MMKKVLCTLLAVFLLTDSFAQSRWGGWERNRLNLRLGPELGFAVGRMNNTQNIATGLAATLDLPLMPRYSLMFHTGFLSFSGDVIPTEQATRYRRTNVFALRAGMNYKLTPNMYTGLQLGHASVKHLGVSGGGLSQSLGIGYFNGRLDVGTTWDHHYVHRGLGSLNARAGYVLFGRRRY